jgi:hypothetical protein
MKKTRVLIAVFIFLSLLSCKEVDPTTQKVMDFGTNLLKAVAVNYTGPFSALATAFVETVNSTSDTYSDTGSGGYDQVAQNDTGYYPQQGGGYDQQVQGGGYDQQVQGGGYDQQVQGGGYDQQVQGGGYDQQVQGGGYDQQAQGRYNQQFAPLALDVAILQKTTGNNVIPIEDGAILRDGRGDPRRGDQFKITFRANIGCFVYVVAADATGYVEPVFPHSDDAYINPVAAGVQYEIPRSASSSWYGLDDYRGIEQFFFIASRQPRSDIERILNDLLSRGAQRKPVNQTIAVTEPTVITSMPITQGIPGKCNNTRGIVRVSDCIETRGIVRVESGQANLFQDLNAGGNMSIPIGNGRAYKYSPETFMTAGGNDLVFTRWFRHE